MQMGGTWVTQESGFALWDTSDTPQAHSTQRFNCAVHQCLVLNYEAMFTSQGDVDYRYRTMRISETIHKQILHPTSAG